ncbi:uncharacterized protein LOC113561770 [Ooceraea biroi]|uniref:uncharacterized protein LOC113561770 n=1 Tax=Ooceraea biroi TaxID=2015173 RepID=UPI000F07790B|nr:uncharacterized protein LOC113561770 [Ooceraea biroi]
MCCYLIQPLLLLYQGTHFRHLDIPQLHTRHFLEYKYYEEHNKLILLENVTGHSFLELLRDHLPTLLEEVDLETRRRMWIQMDGAPPHFARNIRHFLDQNFNGVREKFGVRTGTDDKGRHDRTNSNGL